MTAICVDDERLLMEDTLAMCLELPEIDEARGFVRAGDALEWLEHNTADLALLDIDMPEMNGIRLAAEIKQRSPETAILFLTGYAQYAVDAFAVRASGYLLKPVTKEALAADVAYALEGRAKKPGGRVLVQTFGSFDVFVEGKPVSFKMAKCKELLAYLVDRQGGGVTRPELSAVLWEDRPYDRRMQKQLDVYIRSLRETLRQNGIGEMLEMQRGIVRVRPEQFVCDAYLFFSGDSDAVNAYRGEYMSAYSWASMTESTMYWKVMDKE
ncbi:MAG: response regulator [Oscillospiraceae bacterium]|jgi:two-component SAPR family response regulator|nr:response regulator [Oscillospiraceae bacterium]MBR4691546.1 response regulator [Oscillospiraceae bacterium]